MRKTSLKGEAVMTATSWLVKADAHEKIAARLKQLVLSHPAADLLEAILWEGLDQLIEAHACRLTAADIKPGRRPKSTKALPYQGIVFDAMHEQSAATPTPAKKPGRPRTGEARDIGIYKWTESYRSMLASKNLTKPTTKAAIEALLTVGAAYMCVGVESFKAKRYNSFKAAYARGKTLSEAKIKNSI